MKPESIRSDTARPCFPRWSVAIPLLLVILSAVHPATAQWRGRGGAKVGTVLVDADEELKSILTKAEGFIESEHYPEAIAVLQEMINREKAGYIERKGSKGLYVSLAVRASQLLATMGEEGQRLYESQYGIEAERLYQLAMETGEIAPLREIVHKYVNTSVGPRALERLATIYFDRGMFSQAAHAWRRRLEVRPDEQEIPLLLAKAVAAHHLAGEGRQLTTPLNRLKKEFPEATATLGGREQKLVDFAQRVMKLTPPGARAAELAEGGWPGLTAFADGMGRMQSSDVVLLPQWAYPEGNVSKRSLNSLIAQRQSLLTGRRNNAGKIRYRGGTMVVEQGKDKYFPFPGIIQPVVAGSWAIYRTDETVIARDLHTGELAWKAFAVPMVRSDTAGGNPAALRIRDLGRHRLTVGGDMVFTLYGFRQYTYGHKRFRRNNQPKEPDDTSGIAAISLSRKGKVMWQVGNGKSAPGDDDELVKTCKFVSAPTYLDGRLYVLASYIQEYHVLCLDATTGRVLWRKAICQMPAMQQRSGYHLDYLLSVGSPPAIVDGKVYVCTNAGAVVCIDAATGQGLWAYQYDSEVNTGNMQPNLRDGRPVVRGANPVIVTRGRVICLPADGAQLLCLSTEDGRPMWSSMPQVNEMVLTAIDSDRILLSGPGLTVRSVMDGKTIHEAGNLGDVHGRPAVTEDQVIASGLGRIYRMDLDSYRVSVATQITQNGVVGNLVSIDGALVAANPTGVCAYVEYEVARRAQKERLEKLSGKQRMEQLYELGVLGFGAGRYEHALEDFQAAWKLAGELGDADRRQLLRVKLHACYVSLGNLAETEEKRVELFGKALELSQTDQEKAHMMLRLAYAMKSKPAEAAGWAQKLSDQFGQEKIVDVKIGPDASGLTRLDSTRARREAKAIAQDYIARLIDKHGQKIYAEFDKQAEQALAKAIELKDPAKIHAVAKRWPHSIAAQKGLYAAAEIYYVQGKAMADKEKGESQIDKAIHLLGEVARDKGHPNRLEATVALAMIYANRDQWVAAGLTIESAREADKSKGISFGDLQTTVGEAIRKVDDTEKFVPEQQETGSGLKLDGGLEAVFTIEGEFAHLLRDETQRPVTYDGKVFVVEGSRVAMVDPAASDANDAILWKGVLSRDVSKEGAYVHRRGQLIGGLSNDGSVLAVCDSEGVCFFSTTTGKRRFPERSIDSLGLSDFRGAAESAGVIVLADSRGVLTMIDIGSGTKTHGDYQIRVVGGDRAPSSRIVATAGRVFVLHDGGKRLSCFGIEDARVHGRWPVNAEPQGPLSYAITPGGLLLLLGNDKLQAYDIGRPFKPVWEHEYPAELRSRILACGQDSVVMSRRSNSGTMDVLSLLNGELVAEIGVQRIGGDWGTPVAATLDADKVLLIASGKSNNRFGGQGGQSFGAWAQCFDLGKDGATEPAWSTALDDQTSHSYVAPGDLSPVIAGDYMLFATRTYWDREEVGRLWVVDRRGGSLVATEKLTMEFGEDEDQDSWSTRAHQRRSLLAQPVVASGRVAVESARGVTVLAGKSR